MAKTCPKDKERLMVTVSLREEKVTPPFDAGFYAGDEVFGEAREVSESSVADFAAFAAGGANEYSGRTVTIWDTINTEFHRDMYM